MWYFRTLLIFFILGFWIIPSASSQEVKENEIITVNGEKFIVHFVVSGETIYSLCKKYQVTEIELKKENPDLNQGLKTGLKLKIPVRINAVYTDSQNKKQTEPSKFLTHVIGNQETPYFVAKKYNVTVDDIYKYNPDLKKFNKGKKIRIPQWEIAKASVTEAKTKTESPVRKEKFISHQVKQGETLYSISRNYKVEIPEILFYNTDARNLKEGTVLKIPEKQNRTGDLTGKEGNVEEGNILHIIESGETLFGLTKKYNVSKEELVSLNPDIEKSFPVGGVVKVPLNESYKAEIKENAVNPDLTRHIVLKGETLYSLSENSGIEVVEIKKYNPALNFRGLVEGETVFLPRVNTSVQQVVTTNQEIKPDSQPTVERTGPVMRVPAGCRLGKKGNKTVNVAMFLPLFLDENEKIEPGLATDSVSVEINDLSEKQDTITATEQQKAETNEFYENSENYLCFYEGALLAIDSLRKSGTQVNLSVYDTKHDDFGVRKIISSEKLKETNLIIGPVDPGHQSELAAYAAKNRIPFVSPLASTSEHIKSNSSYFQVNPTREYLYAETAEMVARDYSGSNFIVLKTGAYEKLPEGSLVDIIKEKMTNAGYYSNNSQVNFRIFDYARNGIRGLTNLLSPQKENVLFIATMNEGQLSETLSDLKNISGQFSITLVGNNRYPKLLSLDQEIFHILKLKYLSPYWINYNSPATVNFIRNYRNIYKTEPREFGYQGFDVTFFFCSVIGNYGRDFQNCLKYTNGDLTQGKYYFEKVSEFGGYMNHGLSLISYEPDFSVVCKKIVGQPILVVK
jgi:LysM repeat protein/ABC-type branched-subunit amino acid transport system substrate-binding protein